MLTGMLNCGISLFVKRSQKSKLILHRINDIRFNTKLNQMATAGDDKTLKIFDIKDPADLTDPPVTLTDNEGIIFVIEFSPGQQDNNCRNFRRQR